MPHWKHPVRTKPISNFFLDGTNLKSKNMGSYDKLITIVNDKMKKHEDDNLGFGIFENVDKDLGLSRGTAWDASGCKDCCDFGFGDC
tara:strand:- start:650 stop:910 length:261 start_codon:yes stop_codon:yes gene_type:complete